MTRREASDENSNDDLIFVDDEKASKLREEREMREKLFKARSRVMEIQMMVNFCRR